MPTLCQARGWGHEAPYWHLLAAAAFTDRPWGAAQAQQAGDAPRTIPSLADIMSATQWRHLKLAYSGKVSNWPLANYELGQIQQSFSAAAELYPRTRAFRSHS